MADKKHFMGVDACFEDDGYDENQLGILNAMVADDYAQVHEQEIYGGLNFDDRDNGC